MSVLKLTQKDLLCSRSDKEKSKFALRRAMVRVEMTRQKVTPLFQYETAWRPFALGVNLFLAGGRGKILTKPSFLWSVAPGFLLLYRGQFFKEKAQRHGCENPITLHADDLPRWYMIAAFFTERTLPSADLPPTDSVPRKETDPHQKIGLRQKAGKVGLD